MDGGDMDALAFGQALRKRVDDAAQARFDALMAEMGADIRKAGGEAAARAADDAARAAVRKLGEDLSLDIRRQVEALGAVSERVAATEGVLKGLDPSEAKAAYEAVREEQARLREGRDRLLEDLAKARVAETQLRALALQLIETNGRHEALSTAVAKMAHELQADIDARAARAAALVLHEMGADARASVEKAAGEAQAEALAKLREATDQAETARVSYEAMLDAARQGYSKAMIRVAAWEHDAMERVEKAITRLEDGAATTRDELIRKADLALMGGDLTADDVPLVPRAFRGAWKEGTSYQRGDLVVFFGSTFIAIRDTAEKPYATVAEGAPWQLFAAGGFGGGFSNKRRMNELAQMIEDIRGTQVAVQSHSLRLMVLEQNAPSIIQTFNDEIFEPGIFVGND